MWDCFIIICLENIGIFTKLFLFPWVICSIEIKKKLFVIQVLVCRYRIELALGTLNAICEI